MPGVDTFPFQQQRGSDMALRTACVIGGGIAGLAAGVALQRAGYRVELFEQAPAIAPMGAALSIWGNAMAGLDWLSCGDAVRQGSARVERLALSTSAGTRLFGPVDMSTADAYLPMRSHLQGVMLDALGRENLRLGQRIDDVRESRDRVELFRDGEVVASANLCIVADGIHSAIASRLIGNAPACCGYVGALGIAEGAGDAWPGGHGEEVWHRRERFGLFDAGAGKRYWFYMMPAKSAGEAETINQSVLQSRADHFPVVIGETVQATVDDGVIPVAISARAIPKRLGKGRIICVGDAAHAMEPNQGQGGCQGIEDA